MKTAFGDPDAIEDASATGSSRPLRPETPLDGRFASLREASAIAHAATERATREAQVATERRIECVAQFRAMMNEVLTRTMRGCPAEPFDAMEYAMVYSSRPTVGSRAAATRMQSGRVFLAASFRIVLGLIGLYLTML